MYRILDYIRKISWKSAGSNILVLLVGYLLIHSYQTWDTPTGKVPELQGVAITGGVPIDLREFDKPVLLHFWATWCKICQFEHESINRIAKDYPVLTVASQSGGEAEVLQFIAEKQLKFPVILDEDGRLFGQWGGVGYPTSFVINEENEVEFVETGFTTEAGLRLRLFLAKYF